MMWYGIIVGVVIVGVGVDAVVVLCFMEKSDKERHERLLEET